jgi:hypothetical protein
MLNKPEDARIHDEQKVGSQGRLPFEAYWSRLVTTTFHANLNCFKDSAGLNLSQNIEI